MNIEKFKPWNWFKHEEDDNGRGQAIPVSRVQAENRAGPLLGLQREMDRWLEDAFKSLGVDASLSRFGSNGEADAGMPGFYRARLDVSADDNCYEIRLDVPGLSESDLTLEVRDDLLVVKGEKEVRSEDENRHFYRVERSYGSFQRTLSLPDDANADEIRANLDKGVLKLEIPRREVAEQAVKRIPVSS